MVLCLGEVISEKYALEYGTDCLELHVGAVQPGERAIVIDDLVATGGTQSAGVKLLGDLLPLFGVGEGLTFCLYSFLLYFTCDGSMHVVPTFPHMPSFNLFCRTCWC